MTKILVTGASGAIGTALLERLDNTDYEVLGVDKIQSDWDFGVPILQHNLLTESDLPDADVVVHLAANSQVQPTIDNPSKALENIEMTKNMLEYARENDSDIIFASSREVFGPEICPEDDQPEIKANNPYGASKVSSESLGSAYHSCFGVNFTALRFANVYGPYDTNPRVIPKFIFMANQGKELTVFGSSKILDFIFIRDAAEAIERAIDMRKSLSNESITIGSGQGTRLTELADMITEKIDECPGWQLVQDRIGDTSRYIANTERAEALLDLDPTPLPLGLDKTIEWYQEHDWIYDRIGEPVS